VNWLIVLGAVVAALLLGAWAFDRWRAGLPPERRLVSTEQLIEERRRELRARSPVRRYLRATLGGPAERHDHRP
jgi:hypothetical protein